MDIKRILYNHILESIDLKISVAKESIELAKEARENDTKSSAGDKFETGREMMQAEIDKNESQIWKAQKAKNNLSKIDLNKSFEKVEFGSLVETTNGNYFISIANGKINIKQKDFFTVSLVSPIGAVLINRKVGDKINFNQKEFIIEKIV